MRGIDLNISRNIVIIDLINHNAVCKTAQATLMSTESAIRAFSAEYDQGDNHSINRATQAWHSIPGKMTSTNQTF